MMKGTREKGDVEKAAVNTDDTRRLCLLSTGRAARSWEWEDFEKWEGSLETQL